MCAHGTWESIKEAPTTTDDNDIVQRFVKLSDLTYGYIYNSQN